MGFFGLRRWDLRTRLFDLAANGPRDSFDSLCRRKRTRIRDDFAGWLRIPDELRARAEWYAQGLIAVAAWFEARGDRKLLTLLRGDPRDNPLERWQLDFAEAQTYLERGAADEAVAVLTPVIAGMRDLSGSGVDHWLPRMLGLVGLAYHRLGERDQAIAATSEALLLCQQLGDREGATTYRANLDVIAGADLGGPGRPARGSGPFSTR